VKFNKTIKTESNLTTLFVLCIVVLNNNLQVT